MYSFLECCSSTTKMTAPASWSVLYTSLPKTVVSVFRCHYKKKHRQLHKLVYSFITLVSYGIVDLKNQSQGASPFNRSNSHQRGTLKRKCLCALPVYLSTGDIRSEELRVFKQLTNLSTSSLSIRKTGSSIPN